MAKPIKAVVKLTIPAATANPAPPVGTALGPHGIQIMEFCTQFNQRTADMKGSLVPAVVTIYEDRSFDFITKKPPVSDLIKKTIKIDKGSGETGHGSTVGTLSQAQLEKIAQDKMEDLNANDLAAAKNTVAGTARSMGVKIATK